MSQSLVRQTATFTPAANVLGSFNTASVTNIATGYNEVTFTTVMDVFSFRYTPTATIDFASAYAFVATTNVEFNRYRIGCGALATGAATDTWARVSTSALGGVLA